MTKREMNQPLLPSSSTTSSSSPPSSSRKELWTRAPLSIEDGDSYVDYESVHYGVRPTMIIEGTYIGENTYHNIDSTSVAQRNAMFESARIANDVIDSNHYGWELTEEERQAKLRADLVATKEASSMRSKVLFGNCFDNPEETVVIANQILPTQQPVDNPSERKTNNNNNNQTKSSGYTVSEYTTKEYNISEYKSVYDS